jgi:hypothetical protein
MMIQMLSFKVQLQTISMAAVVKVTLLKLEELEDQVILDLKSKTSGKWMT